MSKNVTKEIIIFKCKLLIERFESGNKILFQFEV